MCLQWIKEINKLSIDSKTLELWDRAYEVEKSLSTAKIRLDLEKLNNLSESSPYIEELKNTLDEEHISQDYNGTDKVTGRIYAAKESNGFNIQTLPEVLKEVVIPESQSILYEYDYKYFEFCLLSQICGVDYKTDPHLELSQYLFKTDEYRAVCKTINYAIIYGKSIDSTISEIKKNFPNLKTNYLVLYDKLIQVTKPFEELKQSLIEEYKKHRVLYNYYGRNIYPQKEEYVFLNNYIQSTAADFIILKIQKLNKYLQQYPSINKILLQKHDSILFNLSIGLIQTTSIVKDIETILTSPEDKLVGQISLKSGKNWKELS